MIITLNLETNKISLINETQGMSEIDNIWKVWLSNYIHDKSSLWNVKKFMLIGSIFHLNVEMWRTYADSTWTT